MAKDLTGTTGDVEVVLTDCEPFTLTEEESRKAGALWDWQRKDKYYLFTDNPPY